MQLYDSYIYTQLRPTVMVLVFPYRRVLHSHFSSRITFLLFTRLLNFPLDLVCPSCSSPFTHSSCSSAFCTHIILYPFLFISLLSHSMALSFFLTSCPSTAVSDFPLAMNFAWLFVYAAGRLTFLLSSLFFDTHSHSPSKNTVTISHQPGLLIKVLC